MRGVTHLAVGNKTPASEAEHFKISARLSSLNMCIRRSDPKAPLVLAVGPPVKLMLNELGFNIYYALVAKKTRIGFITSAAADPLSYGFNNVLVLSDDKKDAPRLLL